MEMLKFINNQTGEVVEKEMYGADCIMRGCGDGDTYHGMTYRDGAFIVKSKAAFEYWCNVEKLSELWYRVQQMRTPGGDDGYECREEDGPDMTEDPIGTMIEDIKNLLR